MNEKMKRQSAIIELVQRKEIKKQEEIINELGKLGIPATQGTISRDLKELNISMGKNSYEISKKAIEESHENELIKRMNKDHPILFTNVIYYYFKTGRKNASIYAYHLEELFPDVILDLVIKDDYLIMLVNLDAEKADKLYALLNYELSKKK